MLFKRRSKHLELAVLRLTLDVLDAPDVVVSDKNAASEYVRFSPSPAGLSRVSYDRVFAEYWTHSNQIAHWQHAVEKCAEILVPDRIGPELIAGAYVSCAESRKTLEQVLNETDIEIPITVDAHLFFR